MQILRMGNVPAGLHEMQNKDCLSFVRKRTVCVCGLGIVRGAPSTAVFPVLWGLRYKLTS